MDDNRFEKCLGVVLEETKTVNVRRENAYDQEQESDEDDVVCFMRNFGNYQKVTLVPVLLVLDDIPQYIEKVPEKKWDDVECVFLCKTARKDIEKGLTLMGLNTKDFVIPMSSSGKGDDPLRMKQGVIFCNDIKKMKKDSYLNFFKDAKAGKIKKKKVKVKALNLPQNGDVGADDDWVQCRCVRCKKSTCVNSEEKTWDCKEGLFDEPKSFTDLMKDIHCNKYKEM